MKKIITVHGICTEGKWQDEIKLVLEPHFECCTVSYDYYKSLGFIKIFFSPMVILITMIVLIVLAFLGHLHTRFFFIVCILGIILSLIIAWFRRHLTLNKFQNDVSLLTSEGDTPHHIIAHSFGTYLTGRALIKWDDTSFNHMILVGCVLHHRFRWKKLLADRPEAFVRVRNEVARKDIVARAAFLAQGIVSSLGYSGFSGFVEGDGFIRRMISKLYSINSSPTDSVKRYQNVKSPNHFPMMSRDTILYNVICKKLGHSDCFISKNYILNYWLPFFFQIDHREFRKFISFCVKLDRFDKAHNNEKFLRIQEQFIDQYWEWAHGTIVDYVVRQISAYLRRKPKWLYPEDITDAIEYSIEEGWRAVAAAQNLPLEQRRQNEIVARKLFPEYAFNTAVHVIMESL